MNRTGTASQRADLERVSRDPCSEGPSPLREWIIRPRRPGILNALWDVWDYRGIFGFIAVNSVLQNNRRRLLGVAWLVIRPALTVVAAVQIVGKVFGVSTTPVPLVLFIVAGLSLWRLFAAGLRYGTQALSKGRSLSRRVSFPRFMLLLGALAPALVEFAVVLFGGLGVFVYQTYTGAFAVNLGGQLLGALPALVLVMAVVTALACVTSILNSMASDTSLTVNYGASILFFATPVVYPMDALPLEWQWAFLLNPLTPALELWRWALLGTLFPPWWSLITAVATTVLLLLGGLKFFLRWEQTMLDRS